MGTSTSTVSQLSFHATAFLLFEEIASEGINQEAI